MNKEELEDIVMLRIIEDAEFFNSKIIISAEKLRNYFKEYIDIIIKNVIIDLDCDYKQLKDFDKYKSNEYLNGFTDGECCYDKKLKQKAKELYNITL